MLSRAGASAPGRLGHRVTLERASGVSDGAGGRSSSWKTVAKLWAEVVPTGSDEQAVGEGTSSVITHKITLRGGQRLAAGDRLRLGQRLFWIEAITDPAEDGRFIVCLAREERGIAP
ncbi:phage head-tail adaptor, putative, SPP1 family [Faunimonas pinastri]|uniref:Phage head-tail adaptor, putative, SPP1 family n=1 Tax=Faunimonas pinastri TaxID=1855383 RepID=A0A1H9M8F5_9HYPH|nr:phage head closure protein [Faunimonas pinastri]SER19986.1 phage head-tail adaptor, putative, SPP1 family [Faunimonas pinastri]